MHAVQETSYVVFCWHGTSILFDDWHTNVVAALVCGETSLVNEIACTSGSLAHTTWLVSSVYQSIITWAIAHVKTPRHILQLGVEPDSVLTENSGESYSLYLIRLNRFFVENKNIQCINCLANSRHSDSEERKVKQLAKLMIAQTNHPRDLKYCFDDNFPSVKTTQPLIILTEVTRQGVVFHRLRVSICWLPCCRPFFGPTHCVVNFSYIFTFWVDMFSDGIVRLKLGLI